MDSLISELLGMNEKYSAGEGGNDQREEMTEDDREELLLPSYDEINEAIEKLINNKSAGLDGLPGEFFQNARQDFVKELTHLLERIWIKEACLMNVIME